MKLVKIEEGLYLNSDFIESVEYGGEESIFITMASGELFSPNIPIKKLLDAISGSEEHSFIGYKKLKNKDLSQKVYVDVNNRQDNNYSIIVSNDNGEVKIIGNRPEVLSSLDLLKNDETLTIKRVK
ncbi:hypothetical protein [Pediococcus pentosaceus]|uniref:hypothetical protein n=1 Tax=Pediococcus pentosaceus TaxID=1255 RepID=UPI00256FCAE1|nr:hypothetical protein [Pediococcus pentosaceus]